MRLLFIINDAEFFLSHRLPIALGAKAAGHEVHVATAPGPGAAGVLGHGLTFHPIPISRRGRNPFAELETFLAIIRLIGTVRPDLVHLVTIKPVLYGGIAARLRRVPSVVAAISGLGYAFDTGGLRRIVSSLYGFALGHPNLRVIFQNPEDRRVLSDAARLPSGKSVLIRGSGVPLERYRYMPEPPLPAVVVFASRLLRTKGLAEFVAAARHLHSKATFRIAGTVDSGNPQTITADELDRWRAEGAVEILGHRDDIPELFAASHIVVLPSYYGEGVPKVLLEAAACGRPIVTTDHPGCRDAVDPGDTGLLVPVRDAEALTAAIASLLADGEGRRRMGAAARRKAEREFDVNAVVAAHLRIYDELASQRAGHPA